MPIQAPQWTEFLSCPVCCHEFAANLRPPVSLGCGHTLCTTCLATLHRKQCPFDQTSITTDLDNLPINHALLQLVSNPSLSHLITENEVISPSVQNLVQDDLQCYNLAKKCIEELALFLKPLSNGNSGNLLSRSMQRKLVTLVNCQLIEDEGRSRALRAARSLGERTVTDLILQHQNPQQLSANLWAAVRARGCQFLGPAMQEEVLKLVLLALEDGSALSRKVLVMFVVQRLEPHFPQASKTSIGHVVQLLYRASCFKVSKREGDSSLMQLKEEFRTYEALRREHDAQIVQIATEAGLRIAPDQWSALLYGDTAHKSHMQSIIDKLQTPQSFAQSVQELVLALQRTGDPANLSGLRIHLKHLAGIDANSENNVSTWKEVANALDAVRQVVVGLVDFVQHHGNRKLQESGHLNHNAKYKISLCRDLTLRGTCPRGTNCTFAHSEEELEKYRTKSRKISTRTPTFNVKDSIDHINESVNHKSITFLSSEETSPMRNPSTKSIMQPQFVDKLNNLPCLHNQTIMSNSIANPVSSQQDLLQPIARLPFDHLYNNLGSVHSSTSGPATVTRNYNNRPLSHNPHYHKYPSSQSSNQQSAFPLQFNTEVFSSQSLPSAQSHGRQNILSPNQQHMQFLNSQGDFNAKKLEPIRQNIIWEQQQIHHNRHYHQQLKQRKQQPSQSQYKLQQPPQQHQKLNLQLNVNGTTMKILPNSPLHLNSSPNFHNFPPNITNRSSIDSLESLRQRRQELIKELEKFPQHNKLPNHAQQTINGGLYISNKDDFNYWNSSSNSNVPYQIDTTTPRELFVRSDSILTDDDYIPFDAPTSSKYGPISRMTTKSRQTNSNTYYPNPFADITRISMNNQTLSCGNTPWINNIGQSQNFSHTQPALISNAIINSNYINQSTNDYYTKTELELELKCLEKQLAELKSQSQTGRYELHLELKFIEQKMKELKIMGEKNIKVHSMINSHSETASSMWNNSDILSARLRETTGNRSEEDEMGIANGIRELELRLESELEEHEKLWTHTEESSMHN